MPWYLIVKGSDRDISYLSTLLQEPRLALHKVDGIDALTSSELDVVTDQKEANPQMMKWFLVAKAMLKLDWLATGTLEWGGLFYVDPNGSKHHYVFIGELAWVRDEVRAIRDGATFPDDAVPRKYVKLAVKDATASRALMFYAHSRDDNWRDLFPVFEIVAQDVGGNDEVWRRGLAGKADVLRFLATAHNPRYSGLDARHGADDEKGRRAPEDRPMGKTEGRSFIRSLLLAWLDFKVTGMP